MAICPKCNAAMAATEAVCPSCGYDFPEERAPRREGIAYSAFADVALVVSMLAVGLGCLLTLYLTVTHLLRGQASKLLESAITFFLLFGMLIVFMRVSDLKE